jgi:N-acetylmuramoyl-L-alanine amidase
MFTVDKNRLVRTDGTPVDFKPTPSQNKPGSVRQTYLVMHYTAGLSLSGSVSWLQNPAAQASAHFVIGRDGAVVQMVELNRRAWHAGESKWGELKDINSHSIGIELDNAGRLQKRADGNYYFVSQSGSKKINPADVVLATHKMQSAEAAWHAYTPEQLAAAVLVGQALNTAFGFVDVLGHDDISFPRKLDPGPAFPMMSYRTQVLGRS